MPNRPYWPGENARERCITRPRQRSSLLATTRLCLSAVVLLVAGFSGMPRATRSNGFAQEQSRVKNPPSDRVRVTEGEYVVVDQVNFGAVGPFGEEVYNFHEEWTLWRNEAQGYEVEGERRFDSPRDSPHNNRFLVRLTRDRTVIDMTEFAKLKWRPDSGPLSCEFLASELDCSSGGTDPAQNLELHTPMQSPFGLLWPISPFSLSGITQEAERDRNRPTEVELARIEQPSQRNPVEVTLLNGHLHYLGEEQVELAGETWSAYQFSLKVALEPEFLIRVSSEGLLLSVAVEHPHKNWTEEGMRLVRFHKFADF